METISIAKQEYEVLKKKASLNDNLLIKLVKGLEDIKAGRIKLWKNLLFNFVFYFFSIKRY